MPSKTFSFQNEKFSIPALYGKKVGTSEKAALDIGVTSSGFTRHLISDCLGAGPFKAQMTLITSSAFIAKMSGLSIHYASSGNVEKVGCGREKFSMA